MTTIHAPGTDTAGTRAFAAVFWLLQRGSGFVAFAMLFLLLRNGHDVVLRAGFLVAALAAVGVLALLAPRR